MAASARALREAFAAKAFKVVFPACSLTRRQCISSSLPVLTRACRASSNMAEILTGEATNILVHDCDDLFHFTRGRFVQGEAHEMASRYVRFNVHELARIAADAVGAKHCVHIEKLADGMHNKALLLTMDNGIQVVGKIPTPNAGQPYFTTASEVATMDVMRSFLGIPVPQVHAWCAGAEKSPVGAEYIILAKAAGVPLKSIWHRLDLSGRFAIAKEIARFQSTWSSVSYEGYGSIYYVSDLPKQDRLPLHSKGGSTRNNEFALGPITGRHWVDDGQQAVTVK